MNPFTIALGILDKGSMADAQLYLQVATSTWSNHGLNFTALNSAYEHKDIFTYKIALQALEGHYKGK